ncbi:MAG: TraB/GumN family protein [Petrimonas sp.]
MEKILTLINEKSTFIAVGTLHLCGENGLINRLKKKISTGTYQGINKKLYLYVNSNFTFNHANKRNNSNH